MQARMIESVGKACQGKGFPDPSTDYTDESINLGNLWMDLV
jgi:hypothetical protein